MFKLSETSVTSTLPKTLIGTPQLRLLFKYRDDAESGRSHAVAVEYRVACSVHGRLNSWHWHYWGSYRKTCPDVELQLALSKSRQWHNCKTANHLFWYRVATLPTRGLLE